MKEYVQKIINEIYENKKIKKFKVHMENENYFGCEFVINKTIICFREANITPNKIGHFVSLWKDENDKNTPYNINDKYDLYMFYVKDNKQRGIFIFSKKNIAI